MIVTILPIDRWINQELEQYLKFFTEYRQRIVSDSRVFAVNNKVYSATKLLSFIANYSRELRIEVDVRRKEKVEKAAEYAKK